MESDDALDFECEYLDLAGVAPLSVGEEDNATPAMRAALEAHMAALLDRARNEPVFEDYTQFRAVAFQALAVMVMRAGCALTEAQRNELLAGLQDCWEYQLAKTLQSEAAGRRIEADDLKRHDIEPEYGGYAGIIERMHGRIEAIEGLAALLQGYPIAGGVPTDTPSRGLFEVFAAAKKSC
jgi:hypothetical protein